MAGIKRLGAELLAQYLTAKLPPGLSGVKVSAATPEDKFDTTGIRILPGKFTFDPYNQAEVDDTGATVLVAEVGWWEGDTEVRCVAPTPAEREALEDYVLNVLLGDDQLAPGIITLQSKPAVIGGAQTTYQAVVTFALDEAEWREEMAFSDKRYSFINLETVLPALVVRGATYTINTLEVDFDVGTGINPDDLAAPVGTENLDVHEDGTVTAA